MSSDPKSGSGSAERAALLRDLLRRFAPIDRLIKGHVAAVRQANPSANQFQGLVISEKEIDDLIAREPGEKRTHPAAVNDETGAHSGNSRVERLVSLFGLSGFETNCLLVCMASEIDTRYERLFAYLQDDVTKRRPSVDLLLDMLCPTLEEKLLRRDAFAGNAPLIRNGLLQLFEDAAKPFPTLLGRYVRLDDRIVSYLLGSDDLDARLSGAARLADEQPNLDSLVLAAAQKDRLARIGTEDTRLILYLQGPYGSGRRTIAEAVCGRLGRRLIIAEVAHMAASNESEVQSLLRLVVRETKLQPATLYLRGMDAVLSEEKVRFLELLLRDLGDVEGPIFLGGEAVWEPAGELRDRVFVRLELSRPTYAGRLEIWKRRVGAETKADLFGLATKFRFSPGQIEDAARTAQSLAAWRHPQEPQPSSTEFFEASRLQSNRKLASLARKIKPKYTWDQIVLPPDRLLQLREICNSVKFRATVYDQWGFDSRLSLGKGLNVLFGGPPGTGKTMAAEVIAGELSLDLYKIDLSSVVSKYIGETEKNLSRIFAEAETSNAILFFDEADSLFGKRTEVRDSHDRYANIEVGYLLQRMEEYEGVAILATNFRKNVDEAFVRRMHFMIDFPLPNAEERLRIWESIWPSSTPRGADLDLRDISRRFELSGGNVRNVALGAAFLAANNGGTVNMRHLLHAIRREYQKMGKITRPAEFDSAALRDEDHSEELQ